MEKTAQEIRFLGFDLKDIEADRHWLDRCIEDGSRYEPSWKVKVSMENEILIELALPTIPGAFMASMNLDVVVLTMEEGDDKQKLRMTAQGFYSVSELTMLPEPALA